MKLNCYLTNQGEIEIKPASRFRDWMDGPVVNNVKRCLPVLMASSHGWEILSPFDFSVLWNGGDKKQDTQITIKNDLITQNSDENNRLPNSSINVISHFGGGIVTINLYVIFETDPGVNLWVGGAPNHFKDGVQPLSALIESDWMPYTFTMNWKITRKNTVIEFTRGEPVCFVFPVQRNLLESCDPMILNIEQNQELNKQYKAALKRRSLGLAFRDKSKQDKVFKKFAKQLSFQKWYTKGEMPDGSGKVDEHQTQLKIKPFVRPKISD